MWNHHCNELVMSLRRMCLNVIIAFLWMLHVVLYRL